MISPFRKKHGFANSLFKAAEKAYKKLLKNYIYLDKNGNPYGSIYIQKGNRIAQMVLAKYYRANFIHVYDVEEIKGVNRGGGYGHTGF